MKKLFLLVIVFLMLISCGDENKIVAGNAGQSDTDVEIPDDNGEVCKEGKTKCQGNFVYKCEDSSWDEWNDCAFRGKFVPLKMEQLNA